TSMASQIRPMVQRSQLTSIRVPSLFLEPPPTHPSASKFRSVPATIQTPCPPACRPGCANANSRWRDQEHSSDFLLPSSGDPATEQPPKPPSTTILDSIVQEQLRLSRRALA